MDGFWFFSGFSVIFTVMFILITTIFAITIIRNVRTGIKNNNSPKETLSVQVVSKRTHNWSNGTNMHRSARTSYYVTFELENGERKELHVNGRTYGEIVEGDVGMLTFQGTRYLNFERSRW